MSYYFAIIGTKDNPIFTLEFGTSRHGGDGQAHFREDARSMNQFIVHSSLDIVEEVVWTTGAMYLKQIDRFQSSIISAFTTGTGQKFLLLYNPDATPSKNLPSSSTPSHLATPPSTRPTSSSTATATSTPPSSAPTSRPVSVSTATTTKRTSIFSKATKSSTTPGASGSGGSIALHPPSSTSEEAVRSFFAEVYENWVKTVMNPFYRIDAEVVSPVFRSRVAGAGRRWL